MEAADAGRAGPDGSVLDGIRVVELGGIGPGPFGTMLLADLGADVIRVERPEPTSTASQTGVLRNRRSVALDLRSEGGRLVAERLLDRADVVVEGFRPGVVERLGLGPEECRARNPALVYARMTGWGQGGPLAASAGHDINYLALTGALHAMGRPGQPPAPPLNLVADFGGGGAFLAIGVLAALHERHRSGQGQVIDVAMSDGAALLTAYIHGLRRAGDWVPQRGGNRLDGGAPYYDTYATVDGGFLAVGAIEPQFFERFLEGLELDHRNFEQGNRADWPRQKRIIADRIGTRTRAAWMERFESLDACVSPVLRWDEVGDHPHHVARGTFEEHDGGHLEPAPAPRLARTPASRRSPPPRPGEHTREVLHELRIDPSTVERWFSRGDIA